METRDAVTLPTIKRPLPKKGSQAEVEKLTELWIIQVVLT